MNTFPVLLGTLCVFALAYRYYSAIPATKVLALDDSRITPSHVYDYGHNYVPSSKWVLFGHHFAAIAGAGPLVGPGFHSDGDLRDRRGVGAERMQPPLLEDAARRAHSAGSFRSCRSGGRSEDGVLLILVEGGGALCDRLSRSHDARQQTF